MLEMPRHIPITDRLSAIRPVRDLLSPFASRMSDTPLFSLFATLAREVGDYTLSGTTGTSSTAIESNTHGTDHATFTEILAEDVATLSTEGNDQAGQYEMSESGTRSDNFVDDGTDSSGAFHVTEGSSGSFDSTTTGDGNNGATSVVETSNTGYSVTQTVSGSNPFTLTESGLDSMTATESGDAVTGDYTRTENGTDIYTLGETGTLSGAFSNTATGTDGYASTETGNHAMQTYARTTTGGGAWTRTVSGGTLTSGGGTNGYTLTESGDSAAGHFSQSETGTDRYGLVQKFDDVSNANGGSTPGNVTFHSQGLPFRDPPNEGQEPKKEKDPQDQKEKDRAFVAEVIKNLNRHPEAKKLLDDFLSHSKFAEVAPHNLGKGSTGAAYNPFLHTIVIDPAVVKDVDIATGQLIFELMRWKYLKKQEEIEQQVIDGKIKDADEFGKQSETLAYEMNKEASRIAREGQKSGYAKGVDCFGHAFLEGITVWGFTLQKGVVWSTLDMYLELAKKYPEEKPHTDQVKENFLRLQPKKDKK